MAKFLEHDGQGSSREVQPVNSSTGVTDAGKMIQLDAGGLIDVTMMPTGIGADTASLETSEDLVAGDIVNIWNDVGTAKVRKAVATSTGNSANGFVKSAYTTAEIALVYFEGTINGLTGLTPATKQFLSEVTAGALTETAPSSTGNVVQIVGKSYSDTEMSFEFTNPIELV